jgi:hypothetical protein
MNTKEEKKKLFAFCRLFLLFLFLGLTVVGLRALVSRFINVGRLTFTGDYWLTVGTSSGRHGNNDEGVGERGNVDNTHCIIEANAEGGHDLLYIFQYK